MGVLPRRVSPEIQRALAMIQARSLWFPTDVFGQAIYVLGPLQLGAI
jgi:hypothetical protein